MSRQLWNKQYIPVIERNQAWNLWQNVSAVSAIVELLHNMFSYI